MNSNNTDFYLLLAAKLNLQDLLVMLETKKAIRHNYEKYHLIEKHITQNFVYFLLAKELVHATLLKWYDNKCISFRFKEIYSILNKMIQLNISDVSCIHDIIGFRLIVNDTVNCYDALQKLCETFDIVSVKDFILYPKSNGYESIHIIVNICCVMCEIQIRSILMHDICTYGSASHIKYKHYDVEDIWLQSMKFQDVKSRVQFIRENIQM